MYDFCFLFVRFSFLLPRKIKIHSITVLSNENYTEYSFCFFFAVLHFHLTIGIWVWNNICIFFFFFLGRMDFKYPWAVYLLFHMHFTQILHTISISLTVILALWRYIAIKWVWRTTTATAVEVNNNFYILFYDSSIHSVRTVVGFCLKRNFFDWLCHYIIFSFHSILDIHMENWLRWFYRIVDRQFCCRLFCRLFFVFLRIFFLELVKVIFWTIKMYLCTFTMSTWMKIPLCIGEFDTLISYIQSYLSMRIGIACTYII